jgi:hypothetical protein
MLSSFVSARQDLRRHIASDEQHELRLLVDEHLHRRADAQHLLRVVDVDTSFRDATRTRPD